jgi:hypothetical protein
MYLIVIPAFLFFIRCRSVLTRRVGTERSSALRPLIIILKSKQSTWKWETWIALQLSSEVLLGFPLTPVRVPCTSMQPIIVAQNAESLRSRGQKRPQPNRYSCVQKRILYINRVAPFESTNISIARSGFEVCYASKFVHDGLKITSFTFCSILSLATTC